MKYWGILSCFFLICSSVFPRTLDVLSEISLFDDHAKGMQHVFSSLAKRVDIADASPENILAGVLESFGLQSDLRHKSLLMLVILEVLEKYPKATALLNESGVSEKMADEILLSFVQTARAIQAKQSYDKKKRWLKKRYLLAVLLLLAGAGITLGITIPIFIKVLAYYKAKAFDAIKALHTVHANAYEKVRKQEEMIEAFRAADIAGVKDYLLEQMKVMFAELEGTLGVMIDEKLTAAFSSFVQRMESEETSTEPRSFWDDFKIGMCSALGLPGTVPNTVLQSK